MCVKATDVGESVYVHTFGAYFGLTVSRVLFRKDVHAAEHKETSVYHSDLFSMIGAYLVT
jgi:ammonium transporter Rh